MKKDDWPVKENDIRPAGPSDKCLYCSAKLGEQHKPECVIRERTVVIDCTIRMVVKEPEHWDKEMIEFMRNESRWCASNIALLIDKGPVCLCEFTTIKYVGEATEEDEVKWGVSMFDGNEVEDG